MHGPDPTEPTEGVHDAVIETELSHARSVLVGEEGRFVQHVITSREWPDIELSGDTFQVEMRDGKPVRIRDHENSEWHYLQSGL